MTSWHWLGAWDGCWLELNSSFSFTRLDYYNALLIGLPFSTIAALQRVQNAAARLLLGLSWPTRRDHVRPALKELHWLPVVYRIQFKLALVMFTIHTRCCPDYLTDSVQACNSDPACTDSSPLGVQNEIWRQSLLWPGRLYETVHQQQFVKQIAQNSPVYFMF